MQFSLVFLAISAAVVPAFASENPKMHLRGENHFHVRSAVTPTITPSANPTLAGNSTGSTILPTPIAGPTNQTQTIDECLVDDDNLAIAAAQSFQQQQEAFFASNGTMAGTTNSTQSPQRRQVGSFNPYAHVGSEAVKRSGN